MLDKEANKAGKTVLITGSSKGLGRALATVFSWHRFNVILHGRDRKDLKLAERAVLKSGVDCGTVIGDIILEKTLGRLYGVAKWRGIDILINNAGVHLSRSFKDLEMDTIKNVMEVNLLAQIRLVKRIFPLFIQRGSGLIVNINSMAGKHPNELESIYCASKYGLRGFMDAFRMEASRHNVRVTNVYVGAMNTSMCIGRDGKDKLIDAFEVADLIYNLCKDYQNMTISEIEIRRNHLGEDDHNGKEK